MKPNSTLLLDEFKNRLSTYTDDEIIRSFNREVEKTGWGTARAEFLSSLHYEFDRRDFDYSSIGNKECLSFKSYIQLDEVKRITTKNNK